MSVIRNITQKIKTHRQLRQSLRSHGINFRQIIKSFKEYEKRKLDIREILSEDYSDDVLVDAYEYCMRKCSWDPATLPDSNVRDFLLSMLFQNEVENGGISQFLSNSSGDMCSETVSALKKIDANAAETLLKALDRFPNGIAPKDREMRNDLMDQMDEETIQYFDELDQTLFEQDTKAYVDFIHLHKDEFLRF